MSLIFVANDNLPAQPKAGATKFEVGTTYWTRSICDHDCVFTFKIVRRTAKQITFEQHGKLRTRGVYIADGVEHCKPNGTYSMCAVISADKSR